MVPWWVCFKGRLAILVLVPIVRQTLAQNSMRTQTEKKKDGVFLFIFHLLSSLIIRISDVKNIYLVI